MSISGPGSVLEFGIGKSSVLDIKYCHHFPDEVTTGYDSRPSCVLLSVSLLFLSFSLSLSLSLSLSPHDEAGCHVMRCLVEMLTWQETEGNYCPTAHTALTLWPTRNWVLPVIPWTSLNPILPYGALRWPQPARDPNPEDPDRLHPGSWPPEAGRSQMVF